MGKVTADADVTVVPLTHQGKQVGIEATCELLFGERRLVLLKEFKDEVFIHCLYLYEPTPSKTRKMLGLFTSPGDGKQAILAILGAAATLHDDENNKAMDILTVLPGGKKEGDKTDA